MDRNKSSSSLRVAEKSEKRYSVSNAEYISKNDARRKGFNDYNQAQFILLTKVGALHDKAVKAKNIIEFDAQAEFQKYRDCAEQFRTKGINYEKLNNTCVLVTNHKPTRSLMSILHLLILECPDEKIRF